MISLLNYLLLFCVCVFVFHLFDLLLIIWLDWVLMSGFWNLFVKNSIKNILISFHFLCSLFIYFFLWFFLNELWKIFDFYVTLTIIRFVWLFNLILLFCLKIMHMAMILMLISCLRRDFGYFVVLKISVILKEKIAFNFPSIFSWFYFHIYFPFVVFFDLVFGVYCNFGVAVFCSGSGKKKL